MLGICFFAYVAGAWAAHALMPPAWAWPALCIAGLLALAALVAYTLGSAPGAEPSAMAGGAPASTRAVFAALSTEAHRRRFRRGITLMASVVALGLGMGREMNLLAEVARWHEAHAALEQSSAVELSGRLVSLPRLRANGVAEFVLGDLQLVATVSAGSKRISMPGRAVIRVRDEWADLHFPPGMPARYGELLRFSGRLELPAHATSPGAFDEFDYHYAQRVRVMGTAGNANELRREEADAPPKGVVGLLTDMGWSVHRSASRAFELGIDAPTARAAVATIVLGHSKWSSAAVRRAYRETGLIHLFALSGLHIAVLAGVMFLVARAAGLGLRGASLVCMVGLPFYLCVTGFRPSVYRATIMVVLYLAPLVFRRRAHPAHTLALAAWVVVALHPEALWHPGFHLSFAAMGGLLFLLPALCHAFIEPPAWAELRSPSRWRGWGRRLIAEPFAASMAVALALLPLLMLYYHQVPLTGNLANIVAIPMASLILVPGFLAGCLAAVSIEVAMPVAFLAGLGATALNATVTWVATWPAVSVVTGAPPTVALMAAFALAWAGWPGWLHTRRPWAASRLQTEFVARFLAAGVLLAIMARPQTGDALRVTFLDVGQGDSIVIEMPSGATVLVDGGKVSAGRSIVAPFLRHHGISHIDVMVATHHDADHIGGLAPVLEEFPVDLIIEPVALTERTTQTFAQWNHLRLRAERRIEASTGLLLRDASGAFLAFVWPPGGQFPFDSTDGNEHSAVVWAGWSPATGGTLLTGDAGFDAEAAMLAAALLPDIEVLKAGHHGSRNSGGEPMLATVQPEVVVISAGRRNNYGHPHGEAMQRYRAYSRSMRLTPDEGSIALVMTRDGTWQQPDGRELW